MPVYQPGIPTGSVPLLSDYQNLQNNFQQLNIAYGVDHVQFSDTSGNPPGGISGCHNILHLTTQTLPSAVPTIGQFLNITLNDNIATDTTLYYVSGGGNVIHLTRNFQPTNAANGSTFLPGGLIMQWGTITTSVNQSDVAVNFTGAGGVGVLNYPFSNWGVWTNMQRSGSNNVDTVYAFNFTTTGFSYHNTSSTNKTFNWFSLGN